MTSTVNTPQRRRPLPALAFIGALCLLTALVWFRVIHRSSGTATKVATPCPTPSKVQAVDSKVVPFPGKVSVLVLNSTSRDGLAGKAKKALEARHFTVTDRPKNDSPTYGGHGRITGVAEIRYGPAASAAATTLGYYIYGARLKKTDSSSKVVIVSLGVKFRGVSSDKQVRRAIAKHGLRFGTVRTTPTPVKTCSASTTSSS